MGKQELTTGQIEEIVREWYEALDRHDAVEQVTPFLAEDGLVMVFPEATLRGSADFHDWYAAVTNRFFDEVHEVKSVEVRTNADGRADIQVVVNWQARVWSPPAARSEWLGFDATQTWTVVLRDGEPKISEYIVEDLAPMPGSAAL
ncbi:MULTISPECIES: nuclear transport factor 2 family protein [Kitasatospora]|uniref:SnoaL-like domain-containing protein n=1 Tax=Kitasatospora cystarginea TaxID=58350 RepID=A0ABP5RMI4_9ACTN